MQAILDFVTTTEAQISAIAIAFITAVGLWIRTQREQQVREKEVDLTSERDRISEANRYSLQLMERQSAEINRLGEVLEVARREEREARTAFDRAVEAMRRINSHNRRIKVLIGEMGRAAQEGGSRWQNLVNEVHKLLDEIDRESNTPS